MLPYNGVEECAHDQWKEQAQASRQDEHHRCRHDAPAVWT
jgi:hypothetical protein